MVSTIDVFGGRKKEQEAWYPKEARRPFYIKCRNEDERVVAAGYLLGFIPIGSALNWLLPKETRK
jgi:hypothetical protein